MRKRKERNDGETIFGRKSRMKKNHFFQVHHLFFNFFFLPSKNGLGRPHADQGQAGRAPERRLQVSRGAASSVRGRE